MKGSRRSRYVVSNLQRPLKAIVRRPKPQKACRIFEQIRRSTHKSLHFWDLRQNLALIVST